MSEQRFPLSWPAGWARTPAKQRRRAAFKQKSAGYGSSEISVITATQRLSEELRRLGASGLRQDGWPRSDQREPEDTGAAVFFKLKGQPRTLACDKWWRCAENIAAIAAHVEAIRAVDRYGVGTLDQAFAGYAQLPASTAMNEWWLVLGVSVGASIDEVEEAHRRLVKEHHPDVGGSEEKMARLNAARDAARKALGR